MAKVLIHATVSLDGFMADADGGVDWMNGFPVDAGDEAVVGGVVADIGGANKTQTVEAGEIPYGGMLGVPVYLMTHSPRDAIEKDGGLERVDTSAFASEVHLRYRVLA